MRSRLAVAAVVALALAPLAFAQGDAAITVTAVDSGDESSYHFSPSALTVTLGQAISVVGGASQAHTFTHDAPVNERLFDSGQVSVGQTKLVRAPNEAGTFPFKCLDHPGMTGTLTVAAASVTPPGEVTPTSLPAPGAALAVLALAVGALAFAAERHRRS